MPYGSAPSFNPSLGQDAAVAKGMESARPTDPHAAGWNDFFGNVFRDPNALTFMLAMGNSLAQPRQAGEGPMTQLSNGLMRGFGMMGLMAQMRQQRETEQQKLALEGRRVGAEEQRTQIAAAGQKQEGEYQKGQLALGTERNKSAAQAEADQTKIALARLGVDQAQYQAARANMDKQLKVAEAAAKNEKEKNQLTAYRDLWSGVDAQLKVIGANSDLTPEQKSQASKDAIANAQKMGAMLAPGLIPPVITGIEANAQDAVDRARAGKSGLPSARESEAGGPALQMPEPSGAMPVPAPGLGGGGTPRPPAPVAPAGTAYPTNTPEGPTISQAPPGAPPPDAINQAHAVRTVPLDIISQIVQDPSARPEQLQAATEALSPYLAQNPHDTRAVLLMSQLTLKKHQMGLR